MVMSHRAVGWVGTNECSITGYKTDYVYDPRTRTVHIYITVAVRECKPIVIKKPTDPCKFPQSPGPPHFEPTDF